MDICIEYYDYDCGCACTPEGCTGHITDIPIGIIVDGVTFYVEGYETGDLPVTDPDHVDKIKAVVKKLSDILI